MAASGRRATATSTSACEVSNLNAARGCSGIGGDVIPRSGLNSGAINRDGLLVGRRSHPIGAAAATRRPRLPFAALDVFLAPGSSSQCVPQRSPVNGWRRRLGRSCVCLNRGRDDLP
jgi:hypothetical protein